jgi:hypothetical protein
MTFELRTYTSTPGKMDALLSRFRDHTLRLFASHGMVSIGYWLPVEEPEQLVYLIRHDGDPTQNWIDFRADPEWIRVAAASVADGDIVASMSSVFLEPTDFSPIGNAS